MSTEYMKIWLLADFTLAAIDWGEAGTSHYWKITEEYDNGDVLVERGGKRALLWKEDVEKGERHSEPNFSLPLGLHLGLERGYHRKWYGKYFKATEV